MEENRPTTENIFDDEDLYGDLQLSNLNEMNYNEMKEKYDSSEAESRKLKQMNNNLRRENDILKKNITSLYVTAKRELERKDAEIKSLQKYEMRLKFKLDRRNRDEKQRS